MMLWIQKLRCGRLRFACLALTAALGSCQALSPTPPRGLEVVFESRRASVHAATLERAREVALVVDEAFAFVQELPHTRRHESATVYVIEGTERAWTGVTRVDAWIEITTGDALVGARFIVAHELVHHLLESDWDPLPQVVEEGLCDTLAARFDPAQGARQRADVALHLAAATGGGLVLGMPPPDDPDGASVPTLIGVKLELGQLPKLVPALELDSRALARAEPESTRTALYGLGFLLAERIGTERLLALCGEARANSRAQIPAQALLDSAELKIEDGWNLRAATERLLGPDEYEVLRESVRRRRREQAGP